MSLITDVLVQGAGDSKIEALNDWLRCADTERQQQFRRITTDAAGGTKWYTPKVWAAAFNYAPCGLLEKLRDPETWGYDVLSVAVIINGEEGSEAFVFDEVHGAYRPVTQQEHR